MVIIKKLIYIFIIIFCFYVTVSLSVSSYRSWLNSLIKTDVGPDYLSPPVEVSNDISGWNVYTNNLFNYSIKYPEDWAVSSVYPNNTYDNGENVLLSDTPSINIYSNNYIIYIKPETYTVIDSNGVKSFENNAYEWRRYYMSSTAELGNGRPKVVKEENILLGGKSCIKNTILYRFEDMEKDGIAIWLYMPLTEDRLLSIKYYSEGADLNELGIYDRIISTLEFH